MTPRPAGSRKLLGQVRGFASRQRIYRTPDALEVDETESYQLHRRRVFFDDVVLVTLHRQAPWLTIVVAGLGALLATAIAVALFFTSGWQVALGVFAVAGVPLWLVVGIRLGFRDHVLTVHGRRTRAQVNFPMRAGRAREAFTSICAAIRRRQDALRRSQQAAEAAAAARSPLPPPTDVV